LSATLKDIADRTRLSVRTVSQILNRGNAGAYRAETAHRVNEAARRLGYRPNALARAIRLGHFGNIALLLSVHRGRSYLSPETLHGIVQGLREQELHLTVAELPDAELTDAGFVPRILREWCCDGLLVNYTDSIPERMIELIEQSRQPAVWLNRKQDHDCVYPDDFAIGRQATEQLLEAGHRRIAYLDWGAGWKQLAAAHYSQRDRQAGYVKAMKDAGLAPQPIRREDSEVQMAPRQARQVLGDALDGLLADDDRPTAFVTYSPDFARRVAGAARERSLRIPADLSLVTTCAGQGPTLEDGTPISAAVVPEREYGREGVAALLEKVAAPQKRLAPRPVAPGKFAQGQTLAPPRGAR
jgi:LacI family transcriptional regulator